MEKFYKGEYGALETKGGQIFNLLMRTLVTEFLLVILLFQSQQREVPIKKVMECGIKMKGSLPSYSVNEVIQGFKANKKLLVRSEKLDTNGHKIILSRNNSLDKVENAVNVVEGANLIHNEYGNRLFADFFFSFNRVYDFTFFQELLSI